MCLYTMHTCAHATTCVFKAKKSDVLQHATTKTSWPTYHIVKTQWQLQLCNPYSRCKQANHPVVTGLNVLLYKKNINVVSKSLVTYYITSIHCVRLAGAGGWCWFFMREKYYWLVDAGWLVLVLCEREILLAGCSEDEANKVAVGGEVEGLMWQSHLN